ncbi:MAG TPA: aldehyde dehydrogenase family protein [Pseudonocardiaceae bacterium]
MPLSSAPAPESPEIARVQRSYRMFVDGKFRDGSGGPGTTINPATEEVLAAVSPASPADVDAAVRAARRAYDRVWSRMPGAERAKYLLRVARLIQDRARELAVLECLNSGMPIRECRDTHLPAVAAQFFYHAGWADKLGYAGHGADPRPLGVAGQVISCDLPLVTAAGTVAPALACGNTVVLKPADTTPLTALVLAEICQQAELPPGVLNVLPGMAEIGAALAGHDGLNTVTFTGSTAVGKRVQHTLAGTGRRLTLALGSPATTVVFDDAPFDQAVDGIVCGAFGSGGAGTRMLVQESIAEQLLAALRVRVAGLRIGDPLDKNTDVGALRSGRRLTRIRELADSAEGDGAQRWTSPCQLPGHGFFLPPTVFAEVSQTMRIAREEITGPVLPVLTFGRPEEAVAKANNMPASRAAGIWTEKGSRIRWAAQRVHAGVAWANAVNRLDPTAAAGGYRESGLGVHGGRAGLAAYLDV